MGYSMFVSGLTHCEEASASPGYTLYTPLSGEAFYLVDIKGILVHEWAPPAGTKCYGARLLTNGNLLAGCSDGSEQHAAGGAAAVVVEMDWDGRVVWRRDHPLAHHDRTRLANGNTAIIQHEFVPDDFARQLLGDQGGDQPILGECVLEVTPDYRVVWEWHSHESLDPVMDGMSQLPRQGAAPVGESAPVAREWLHANAVEELLDGGLLLSFNATSSLIMVDRSSGQVRWRLAKETTQSQHNPSLLENGHVLVFDNGSRRNFSRVIEIDPESQEIVWEYTGEPKDSFYSQNISGCQRLPNGNTLICEGRSGRLFEVTPEKSIVWEYINPFVVTHRGETSRAVFRALRYSPAYEGLKSNL